MISDYDDDDDRVSVKLGVTIRNECPVFDWYYYSIKTLCNPHREFFLGEDSTTPTITLIKT